MYLEKPKPAEKREMWLVKRGGEINRFDSVVLKME